MKRTKGQNGKGSACRTENTERYRNEHDRIFGKKKETPTETIQRKLIQGPRNDESNRD